MQHGAAQLGSRLAAEQHLGFRLCTASCYSLAPLWLIAVGGLPHIRRSFQQVLCC